MNDLEKKLQAKILRKINQIPGCVAFANVVTAYSPTGHCDVYGTVYGYGFWAEVKLPGEKLTKIQRAFLDQVGKEAWIGNTFVCSSVEEAVKSVVILARWVKKVFEQGE